VLHSVPDFVRDRPLLQGAYGTALAAHHGPRRRGDTDIEHPVGVATLLDQHGFSEEIVAAALLHDVVEDTDTDIAEIRGAFGDEVADLVERMTEDQTIRPYGERKAEHRHRVAGDRRVAAIYAADKLAHTKQFNTEHVEPSAQRLEHYRRTLVELSDAYPSLDFLAELRSELDHLG
jgi:(p)ppGpp synthase/HD superfamily hydrolase